jgi:N6-L-threonylcarbamoyladenine synthase
MTILGIETSCDETAAAVVRDGREVLSSVVYSQVPLHQPYGGVVPEIASRSHVEKLPGVILQAVEEARLDGGTVGQLV